MQRTPLYDLHRSLGARLVPFGGFEMPLSYADITTEHHAVRKEAGWFDLSHMGRVRFRGRDALKLALAVQTADAQSLMVGRTRYGMILRERGGIIDDILISREEDGYLLVVNAGNRGVDQARFVEAARGLEVDIVDDSERLAMVAVQGPAGARILDLVGLGAALDLKYYRFGNYRVGSLPILVSRTGYTGEDGFELLLPPAEAGPFSERILAAGRPLGLIPCGLGCRDTLRLEAGMPLHGHEIDAETNPIEAGLEFGVRASQEYAGAAALARVRAEGPKRRLIGLSTEGSHIPRQGHEVQHEGRPVGVICSGTRSPTLNRNIATALVLAEAAAGPRFEVTVRKHSVEGSLVPLPFYKRASK